MWDSRINDRETRRQAGRRPRHRRFIKSRAYVPMHELRRRFELNGEADDVSPVDTPQGLIYLGLPLRESRLIGELVRQG